LIFHGLSSSTNFFLVKNEGMQSAIFHKNRSFSRLRVGNWLIIWLAAFQTFCPWGLIFTQKPRWLQKSKIFWEFSWKKFFYCCKKIRRRASKKNGTFLVFQFVNADLKRNTQKPGSKKQKVKRFRVGNYFFKRLLEGEQKYKVFFDLKNDRKVFDFNPDVFLPMFVCKTNFEKYELLTFFGWCKKVWHMKPIVGPKPWGEVKGEFLSHFVMLSPKWQFKMLWTQTQGGQKFLIPKPCWKQEVFFIF